MGGPENRPVHCSRIIPMKFGIIQFLGSNCEADTFHVVHNVLKQEAVYLWHEETDLKKVDCVILPGGFSHGDYLREGAMAARSPIMQSVAAFADRGGLVLGICNGFQILCEAKFLPGVLVRNKNLQFISEDVELVLERTDTLFTSLYNVGQKIRLPIANMEGHYYIDDAGLTSLKKNNQIVLRYTNNPNGSIGDIAGIINEKGNVFGLMPHPERASEKILGNNEGRLIFESIIKLCRR